MSQSNPPTPNFHTGHLFWDVEKFQQAEELQVFRDFFYRHCAGLKGLKAADCISDALVERIPFGDPEADIFNAGYSPQAEFEKHLKGKPGHCVTYSTYTANSLLSVGIPAKLVQIFPEKESGHNIVTVWEEGYGWVAFDPLNESIFKRKEQLLPAFETVNSDNYTVERLTHNKPRKAYLVNVYDSKEFFHGAVLYVEPWLYTRVGEKQSPFWYRAEFVAVGNQSLQLGILQTFLRYGIIFNLFLLVFYGIKLFQSVDDLFLT